MATLNEVYPVNYNVLSSDAFQQLDTTGFKSKYDEMIKAFEKKWKKGAKGKDLLDVAWTYITTGEIDPLNVIKGVLSVLTLIPEVGTVASAASTIVSFIWPKIFGDKPNAKNIFEELKPQIEALIQQDITNYQDAINQKKFDSLQKTINLYTVAIDNNDYVTAKTQLENLNSILTSDISIFIPEGYETGGLPYYAMVANAHILLLRDAIVNAEKLGFSDKEVDTHKKYIKMTIHNHTEAVIKAFLNGLDKFKSLDVNSYNKKANYIKGMTEMVLDLVALWPTFDPDHYQKEVEIEFTRTISSPIYQPVPKNMQNTSSSIVPSDLFHYQGDLVKLEFSTRTDNDGLAKIFTGIRNTFYKSPNTHETYHVDFSYNTQSSGNISRGSSNPIPIDLNNPIISTCIRNSFYKAIAGSSVLVNFKDGTQGYAFAQAPTGGAWDHSFIESDGAPEGHKLNYIYTSPGDTLRDFINVYTLISTPTINELSTEKIKGFPAEKGYIKNQGIMKYYGKPEYINGAQPVNLENQQTLIFEFHASKTAQYTIRIRYASTQGTKGYFRLDNQELQTLNIPTSHNGYVTGNIGENYDLYTIGSYTITEGNHTLQIQHNDKNGMVLDRIEFVPKDSLQDSPQDSPPEVHESTIIFDKSSPTIWSSNKHSYSHIHLEGSYTSQGSYPHNLLINLFHPTDPNRNHTIHVNNGDMNVDYGKDSVADGLNFNKITATIPSDAWYSGTITSMHLFNDNNFKTITPKFELSNELENITTQVNALFASSAQDTLASNVSDYWIEQVVMKVDALSDEVFGKEKKALRKLVNQAKRLSKIRNLLIGGNFDNLVAWYMGKDVVKESDHELFKSDHVLLPPPTFHPSYIFQKVEESKLKPNTRYTISGFIAHGEDVELVVSRYGQEIQKVMQVPYEEALPLTSESNSSCCVPNLNINETLADPHFFSYSIDVGSLEMEANPGIEFGLRIVKPTGMARVSNLEIREDRPLTAKEIRQVQRAARDWKQNYEQERTEITAIIQPVLNQINALYENEDWNGSIRSNVSYHDLEQIMLPTLLKTEEINCNYDHPAFLLKVYHWFMTDRIGEHGTILARFQEALDRAYTQLESRNLLHNGHFTTDTANWTIEGDAHHTILEDGRRVLRLPDWSSNATQTIEIEDFDLDQEYQLLIHAKGKGSITLQHGEENEYVETHTHHTNDFITSQNIPFTFKGNQIEVHITSEDGEFLIDHITVIEVSKTDTNTNIIENSPINTSMNSNVRVDIPRSL
ncbi:hypothetical protein BM74_19360 [Bacillus thuringiensis]|uniref:Pesticidal crystal protein Cry12Aa n=2 Tax=Bacillus thuringiensis TaxID=1428 RepID=C12AA_BACTU